MDTKYFIAYGLFFLIVGIEFFFSTRRKLKLYQGRDTSNNIMLGILANVFLLVTKVLWLGFFILCNRIALFDFEMTWWAWILLFLLNDLIFYWFHRMSHVVRVFWAFHVAHHSSEQYNFSTAVRNNFLIQAFRYFFWAPIALLGFDPLAIILMDSLAYMYQLFVHTQTIRSLRFFEWFLNTPSHHRVHHGTNPEYIDKNYGAILIIWDKLFGTFQKEEAPVRFGITTPVQPQNVPNILFHELISIGKDMGKSTCLVDALKYVFGHPGWNYKKAST